MNKKQKNYKLNGQYRHRRLTKILNRDFKHINDIITKKYFYLDSLLLQLQKIIKKENIDPKEPVKIIDEVSVIGKGGKFRRADALITLGESIYILLEFKTTNNQRYNLLTLKKNSSLKQIRDTTNYFISSINLKTSLHKGGVENQRRIVIYSILVIKRYNGKCQAQNENKTIIISKNEIRTPIKTSELIRSLK